MSRARLIAAAAAAITAAIAVIGILSFHSGYPSFLNIEGLIIVVGGSVANAFLSYRREDVRKAFFNIRNLFKKQKTERTSLHKDIMQIIAWSYVVQAHDFLGLEKESARETRDPLLRYGIDLVVTGYAPDKIREMLHTVADAEFERRCMPVTVLRNMAATAPAFGMVGTLIGMVILLNHVGADITNIGSGLGIAMLSTLYGILTARLLCLPAADKLLQKEESERFRNYMLSEGMALLAEKRKPFYVQDKLNSFLEPSEHFDLNDYVHMAYHRQFALAA